jgi:hypothetical protein
VEVNTEGSF